MSDDTILVMDEIGVPLYSARGLTQTLTPSPEAKPNPRRTINGEGRSMALAQMQKYDSTITCKDQSAPALDNVWPGMTVVVSCIQELGYPTATGTAQRTAVAASERTTADGFTYYRPKITFIVLDKDEGYDEWPHDYQWKLTLREK